MTVSFPKILLCVTGCVQAEVTPNLVASLLNLTSKAQVQVAATESSLQFFDKKKVAKQTGHPVFVKHSDGTSEFPVPHISLAEWADLVVVYPASANTVAKCANGICDTLVSTVVLSARCPVYFGPCMNDRMYEHSITQRNLKSLEEAGYKFVPREMGLITVKATGKATKKMYCTEGMVLKVCREVLGIANGQPPKRR